MDQITGFATLKGNGKIEVKSDAGVQTLEAKNIILATGSEARMLPGLQPDPEFILTNIEILNLTAVPKSLIVIGAGAVGVEFASIFNRFGTDVTVFEMLPRIVPVEDEDVSKELDRSFRKTEDSRGNRRAGGEYPARRGKGVQLTLTTRTASRRRSKPRSCWWPWAASPIPKRSAWKTRRSSSTAVSSRWTVPADRRAGHLRHRRRRGRHAATGARRHPRRHDRRGAHGRQIRRCLSTRSHPRMHLYGAGHRQRRPHRSSGARAGHR